MQYSVHWRLAHGIVSSPRLEAPAVRSGPWRARRRPKCGDPHGCASGVAECGMRFTRNRDRPILEVIEEADGGGDAANDACVRPCHSLAPSAGTGGAGRTLHRLEKGGHAAHVRQSRRLDQGDSRTITDRFGASQSDSKRATCLGMKTRPWPSLKDVPQRSPSRWNIINVGRELTCIG